MLRRLLIVALTVGSMAMAQHGPELGEMIEVFDEVLVDSEGILEGLVSRQYGWDGTAAAPMATMSMRYDVNPPIDASLFGP